jgi:ATP-dependent DNA helicase RecQ
VLLGKDNERIRRFGHDRVSTHGIGKELSAEQWKSVYRQLVAAGMISVDVEGHGALKLTDLSRPVLRGERSIRLRQDPARRSATREGRPEHALGPADPEANALWERLRACRRELAQEKNVPPYVIFSDATLREMVLYRPRNADELSRVSGVGAVKLQRFGSDFLGVLCDHQSKHGRPRQVPTLPDAPPKVSSTSQGRTWDAGLSGTVRETLGLFRAGISPDEIAASRSLKTTTIYTHLARCIEECELELADVVQLSGDEIKTIGHAFNQLPDDSPYALKPVFETFQGKYDYGLLRCVRAGLGLDTSPHA